MGTLAGDQFFFYLGRIKGKTFLESRPAWLAKSQKVFDLLHRHERLLILGFRFLYGLRTVTPFIVGASNISPLRFFALDAGGSAIWALVIGILGYLFGYTLEVAIGDIKQYELWIFFALLTVGVSIRFIYRYRKTWLRHDG